ncbi:MAG: 5-formyltetrahydrofolate cyclo-ligase [Oscillospiraceae bacterium]|nr:5-formyltetrahydrofolate cyclo-ligase [Oscillospiraceae bacterium]
MNEIMLKVRLRELTLDKISHFSDAYIAESNMGILQNILSLKEYKDAQSIMLFFSVEREPDTHQLAKIALADQKKVAFPLCFGAGLMQAHVVSSLSELRPAVLGIPAPPESAPFLSPDEIDLIIVPALTYDKLGFRLGYGGGYYDRYLAATSAHTIGITRAQLLMDQVPKEPHDIPVKCLVTEKEVYHCPTIMSMMN